MIVIFDAIKISIISYKKEIIGASTRNSLTLQELPFFPDLLFFFILTFAWFPVFLDHWSLWLLFTKIRTSSAADCLKISIYLNQLGVFAFLTKIFFIAILKYKVVFGKYLDVDFLTNYIIYSSKPVFDLKDICQNQYQFFFFVFFLMRFMPDLMPIMNFSSSNIMLENLK